MSTVTEEFDMIPECLCGGGRMKLLCAGEGAIHVGRYYYKFPDDAQHSRSFLWCDDYHSRNGDGKLPDFVKNQLYRPNKQVCSGEVLKKKRSNTGGHCGDSCRCRVEARVNLLLAVMAVVLFMVGFVIGKVV